MNEDKGRLERHKPLLGIYLASCTFSILLDYTILSVVSKTPQKFDPKKPIGQQTKPVRQLFEAAVLLTLCERPNHSGTLATLLASQPATHSEAVTLDCREFEDGNLFFWGGAV